MPSPSMLSSPTTVPISARPAVVPDSSSNIPNTSPWIGGIVGALVGGLFLGFFAGFIILWRQTHQENLELEFAAIRPERKRFDSRGVTASPNLRARNSLLLELDHFLALPSPNNDLASELRSVGHLIQQHVESFYHLSSVSQHPGTLREALSDIGLGSTEKSVPGPSQLASRAISPDTRHTALQHVIARVIFGSMSVDSMRNSLGKLSLLPASVASIINHVAPCEPHLGNQKGPSQRFQSFRCGLGLKSSLAVSIALTRWRHLSVFLMNPECTDRGPLVPDGESLKPQAQEIVNALNSALGAFVDGTRRAQQEMHLLDVVLECAKLGYMIFSQPAEYAYSFSSADEHEMIVCPGLLKAAEAHGLSGRLVMVVAPVTHCTDSDM